MSEKRSSTKDKITAKNLDEYRQEKPIQLTLFEFIDQKKKKYSNTIELYDFTPKYYWSNSRTSQLPAALERKFECRQKKYLVIITPARLKGKDNVYRDYYPSEREELVEDALRKLATEGNGIFLDDRASVLFNIHQLQQLLTRDNPQKDGEKKSKRHRYSRSQIIEALTICAKTNIEIRSEDGESILMSNIFETLALNNKSELNGRKIQAFVRFNALVTNSIKELEFRPYNYDKSLSFNSIIARQLYKRMFHHFTQAHPGAYYNLNLTTIIRDLGMKEPQHPKTDETGNIKGTNEPTRNLGMRKRLQDVKEAIDAMIKEDVVSRYEIKEIHDTAKRKGTLKDATVYMYPTESFVADAIQANNRQKEVKQNGQAYKALDDLKNSVSPRLRPRY